MCSDDRCPSSKWAGDDAYIAQADIDLNGGSDTELKFRYANPDNYYAVRIGKDTGGSSAIIPLGSNGPNP